MCYRITQKFGIFGSVFSSCSRRAGFDLNRVHAQKRLLSSSPSPFFGLSPAISCAFGKGQTKVDADKPQKPTHENEVQARNAPKPTTKQSTRRQAANPSHDTSTNKNKPAANGRKAIESETRNSKQKREKMLQLDSLITSKTRKLPARNAKKANFLIFLGTPFSPNLPVTEGLLCATE